MHRRAASLLALVVASGCGPAVEAEVPAAAGTVKPPKLVEMTTPSILVPEMTTDVDDEGPRYLVSGLRILRRADGLYDRATERFDGNPQWIELSDRLGGGFLFYQSDTQGTRFWRTRSWTDKLTPLCTTAMSLDRDGVTEGFDRLYLRASNNRVSAIDAETGKPMPIGPLPPAAGYGGMAFADGWRGVVETDLRGPLVSYDAGASWHPLDIDERIDNVSVLDGDPVLWVDEGYYRLDRGGHVQLVRVRASDSDDGDEPAGESEPREPNPLGERPLRTAVMHGWPDGSDTAVLIWEGKLVRVRLPDAEVLAQKPRAIEDETARCHGARVGDGFGFVCGVEHGATTIYRFRAPLELDLVASFAGPRFVSAAGNGALAVRGRCDREGPESGDMRTYCIVDASGDRHEIAVRGEIGNERVVPLSDGRVAVLVPPRLGRPGRLTLIDGDKLTGVDLSYPPVPAGTSDKERDAVNRALKQARRGLWLEGFEQRGKDAIGGWVEAGGPVAGVTVKLDGKVEVGKLYEGGGQVLFSGRFALAVSEAETATESHDGGKTWHDFDLPSLGESQRDPRTRGCSPLGCALRSWVRVGWGKAAAAHQISPAPAPEAIGVEPVASSTMRLSCDLVAVDKSDVQSDGGDGTTPFGGWTSFRGVPPPTLGKDQIGVDKPSTSYVDVPVHVYVWGPKGADWTRAGWWTIRFDDRFAPESGVRASAATRPPWGDDVSAAEAIGARQPGSNYWRWEAALDPSGRAAIVDVCQGPMCVPYAVGDGRPILPLFGGTQSTQTPPVEHGVARVGETWYMLTESQDHASLFLWRSEIGALKRAGRFRRVDQRRYQMGALPRLVRRALGSDLGLLVSVAADPSTGRETSTWQVLPIDLQSGALGEPIDLGPSDLDGHVPRKCNENDDGWLLDTRPPLSPAIDLAGVDGYVDDVEMRLRLEPGAVCVEAFSGKSGRELIPVGKETKKARDSHRIPLSVHERYGGKKWQLDCSAR